MRVDVYWNLNRGGYSIRACEGEHKGKVIGYAAGVDLANATFTVQQGARLRVIRDHCKSVHAWIKGELVATHEGVTEHAFEGVRVTYDPYRFESFVSLENPDSPIAIKSAESVSLRTNPQTKRAHVRALGVK